MDLIRKLRISSVIAGPEARKLYLAAAEEIELCHARLEIYHHLVFGDGDELVRRDSDYEGRHKKPDAIDCRDATIELLEQSAKTH
ncbi:MAG: hypothetical protein COA96_15570 [SAR86 cluster bacterium]|uniref:Uncharacterized protein n=1 Tax=SAR86 cluster bacterium TaxID=2030880 RepID=A0A2A5ANF1_9GAMM|nr:MAG: hypothetical protein COA96_15570 [SAR86 cluster bacterium]